MLNKDVNAIVGVVMILGLVFVSLNIMVDVIVAYLTRVSDFWAGGVSDMATKELT